MIWGGIINRYELFCPRCVCLHATSLRFVYRVCSVSPNALWLHVFVPLDSTTGSRFGIAARLTMSETMSLVQPPPVHPYSDLILLVSVIIWSLKSAV